MRSAHVQQSYLRFFSAHSLSCQTCTVLSHLPADQLPAMREQFELSADASLADVVREFATSSPLSEGILQAQECTLAITALMHELDQSISGGDLPLSAPPSVRRAHSATSTAVAETTLALASILVGEEAAPAAAVSSSSLPAAAPSLQRAASSESASGELSSLSAADMWKELLRLCIRDASEFTLSDEGFESHELELKAYCERAFEIYDRDADGHLSVQEWRALGHDQAVAFGEHSPRLYVKALLKLLATFHPTAEAIFSVLNDLDSMFAPERAASYAKDYDAAPDEALLQAMQNFCGAENSRVSRQKVRAFV